MDGLEMSMDHNNGVYKKYSIVFTVLKNMVTGDWALSLDNLEKIVNDVNARVTDTDSSYTLDVSTESRKKNSNIGQKG